MAKANSKTSFILSFHFHGTFSFCTFSILYSVNACSYFLLKGSPAIALPDFPLRDRAIPDFPTPVNDHYPSPGQANALVTKLGYLAQAVIGHYHRRTLPDKFLHSRHDNLCSGLVESRGGLIHEKQPGTSGEGSGQGYSLAFPTRKMGRKFV
jgi:hypothetical protein